jgi:hypothetical protein
MGIPLPESGRKGKNLFTQKISLDVPGGRQEEPIQVYGNVITVWDASSDGILCELNIRGAVFDDPIPWGLKASYKGVEFDKIYLTHEQKSEWIKIQTTYIDDIDYESIEPAQSVRRFRQNQPNGLPENHDVTIPSGESRKILEQSERKETLIHYLSSSPSSDPVRIAGTDLSSGGSGLPVTVGQTIGFSTQSAIYGYNPGSDDAVVNATETVFT